MHAAKYRIVIDIPIDGDSPAEVLAKFRDWLTNQEDPFMPFVDLYPDGQIHCHRDINMEAFQWLHRAEKEFMQPQVEQFDTTDLDCGIEEVGWYCRLSAPGYMDCTEWSGPFETELEAILNLYEMYGG